MTGTWPGSTDVEGRTWPYPLGDGEAVLLLDPPGFLAGPEPPDLSGFEFAGDPVCWLWTVPISGPAAAGQGPGLGRPGQPDDGGAPALDCRT